MRKVEEKIIFFTVLTISRIIRLIQNGQFTTFFEYVLAYCAYTQY